MTQHKTQSIDDLIVKIERLSTSDSATVADVDRLAGEAVPFGIVFDGPLCYSPDAEVHCMVAQEAAKSLLEAMRQS